MAGSLGFHDPQVFLKSLAPSLQFTLHLFEMLSCFTVYGP